MRKSESALVVLVVCLLCVLALEKVHAQVYVHADLAQYTLTGDLNSNGSINLGDTVTWNGGSLGVPVPNLIYGAEAFTSVRLAVFAANAGETVFIAEGRYLEGRQVEIEKNITLQGDGSELTVLDGGNDRRVVRIGNAEAEVLLSGLTLRNGNSNGSVGFDGGGIYNLGTLTLLDCSVIACGGSINGGGIYSVGDLILKSSELLENFTDQSGGGIFCMGNLDVSNSTISSNTARQEDGGGINSSGDAVISGSVIAMNRAEDGGGISGSNMLIEDTQILGNTATQSGGGVRASRGILTIVGSTISDNNCNNGGGGGLNWVNGSATISQSTISGNSAFQSTNFRNARGGGIYLTSAATEGSLTIMDSVLFGNSAEGNGGGIYNTGGYLTAINSTFSGNSSNLSGGALETASGRSYLVHCTVANNTAPGGMGGGVVSNADDVTLTDLCATIVSGNIGGDVTGSSGRSNSFVSSGFNLIQGGIAVSAFNAIGDQTGAFADPLLGPLADNGGPTMTHALLPGSHAIDGASDIFIPINLESDQRGFTRSYGGSEDIGAFELSPSIYSISAISAEVEEGDTGSTQAEFLISRNGPTNEAGSIDWSIALTGTLDADDFNITSGTVNFGVGEEDVSVIVLINGDNFAEEDEMFAVELLNPLPSGAVIDGVNLSATGRILNDDHSPIAIADGPYTVFEDSVLMVSASDGLVFNDSDLDDGVSNLSVIEIVNVPERGMLMFASDGSFTYTPDPNYFGSDSFVYRVSDGANTTEAVANIVVSEQVDLELTVDVLQSPLVAGGADLDVFFVSLVNGGPSNATGITVLSESLPRSTSILAATPSLGSYIDGAWSLELLEGESATLKVTMQAGSSAATGEDALPISFAISQLDQPDSVSTNNSADAAIDVISADDARVDITSATVIDYQTGLLSGEIRVTNNGDVALPSFRVYVDNLPSDVELYNATGSDLIGNPPQERSYILINTPLQPGESIALDIDYFRANLDLDFLPLYIVALQSMQETPSPVASPGDPAILPRPRIVMLGEGSTLIEIASVPGQRYAMEYTDDNTGEDFMRSSQTFTAVNNRLQIIDSGPPLTITHPTKVGCRLYRFVLLGEPAP